MVTAGSSNNNASDYKDSHYDSSTTIPVISVSEALRLHSGLVKVTRDDSWVIATSQDDRTFFNKSVEIVTMSGR